MTAQQWANYFASLPKSDEELLGDRVAQLTALGFSVAEAERKAANELNLHYLVAEDEADETDVEHA